MAHWAELDENNIVLRVTVGSNDDLDEGYQWLIDNLGGKWVKCSYNTVGDRHILGGTPFRKNYPAPGFIYDEKRDAFIPQQPFTSWTLNESTCLWDAPTAYPTDEKNYRWDEETLSWIGIQR